MPKVLVVPKIPPTLLILPTQNESRYVCQRSSRHFAERLPRHSSRLSGRIQPLHTILGWEADAILRKGTADDGDLRSHYGPAAKGGARALDSREGLR